MHPTQRFIGLLFFVLGAIGVFFSFSAFRYQGLAQLAKTEAASLGKVSGRIDPRNPREQIEDLQQKWASATAWNRFSPEPYFYRGRAFLVASLTQRDPQEKIVCYCQALFNFYHASRLSPRTPSYQIALADMQGQLGDGVSICRESAPTKSVLSSLQNSTFGFDALSADRRLDWAYQLAPFDGVTTYLIALTHLGQGRKTKALELLRHNQESNPYFNDEQRQYVYQLVLTANDLKAALPQRYPEIAAWLHHFYFERPADYRAWEPIFRSGLDTALSELQSQLRKGEIRPLHYAAFLKQIAALPLALQHESLRQKLDRLLAEVYAAEGNAAWSTVLTRRRSLERLSIFKGFVENDIKPTQSMLYDWHSDSNVSQSSIDKLGQSMGIHISDNRKLDLLILESALLGSRLDPSDIHLLVSSDNIAFHPYQSGFSSDVITIDDREAIVFNFDNGDFRYLKLYYAGSNQRPRFGNSLFRLISAYGHTVQ